MRVHKGLSNALQAALGARPWWVIRYKADIYTHLGIYAGRKQTNPKGIPACIYSQRLEPDLPAVLARARESSLCHLACNGCWQADWDRVLQLSQEHPFIIPNLGLHPW